MFYLMQPPGTQTPPLSKPESVSNCLVNFKGLLIPFLPLLLIRLPVILRVLSDLNLNKTYVYVK